MKLKVYEVKAIHFDGRSDYEQSFLYVKYGDTVQKFRELVLAAKQLDWIKEGLESGDEKYILKSTVDYWSFHIDSAFDYKSFEVTLKEREVL